MFYAILSLTNNVPKSNFNFFLIKSVYLTTRPNHTQIIDYQYIIRNFLLCGLWFLILKSIWKKKLVS